MWYILAIVATLAATSFVVPCVAMQGLVTDPGGQAHFAVTYTVEVG